MPSLIPTGNGAIVTPPATKNFRESLLTRDPSIASAYIMVLPPVVIVGLAEIVVADVAVCIKVPFMYRFRVAGLFEIAVTEILSPIALVKGSGLGIYSG